VKVYDCNNARYLSSQANSRLSCRHSSKDLTFTLQRTSNENCWRKMFLVPANGLKNSIVLYILKFSQRQNSMKFSRADNRVKVFIRSNVAEINLSVIRAMRSDNVLKYRCLCSHTGGSGISVHSQNSSP
jgi:hypothetical protein